MLEYLRCGGTVRVTPEIIHPGLTQVPTGSGSNVWLTPTGSSLYVDMAASPGTSGCSPNGQARHSARSAHTYEPTPIHARGN